MFKKIGIAVIFLLALTSCDSNSAKKDVVQSSHKDSEQTIANYTNNESKEQKISLIDKIRPPKFIITHFDMNYIEEKHEIFFNMSYEFDSEIYEILATGNQELHFILEYPENIVDIINQTHSDAIKAEKPSNFNTKYQVTFTKKIKLTEDDLEKIKENISGFNLLIADIEKDIIARYVDLYGFNQYASEKSKNKNKN